MTRFKFALNAKLNFMMMISCVMCAKNLPTMYAETVIKLFIAAPRVNLNTENYTNKCVLTSMT